jgi:hypothetical protein
MHAANPQGKGPKRLEDREDRDFLQKLTKETTEEGSAKADCFVFFASIRVHSRLLFASIRGWHFRGSLGKA